MEPPLKSPGDPLEHPGAGKDAPHPSTTLDPGLENQAQEPENWRGVPCPRCGRETFRLLPYGYTGNRKACPRCLEARRRLFDYKARLTATRQGLRPGGAGRHRASPQP